jgi:hypothetical protein
MIDRRALRASVSLLACLAAASCSGGGGGGSAGTTSFQVSNLSVPDGSVWQINREIVFTFTEPVDFTTVSANTINIRSIADVPATGVFRLRDPQTVVFQPNCPTLDDFSDAGLLPGGVTYVLRVPGLNSSPNTVRSLTGTALGIQQTRTFSTPASTQASVAFQDTVLGPPAPIRREVGSSTSNATYLEIGGDPDQRVYFELDSNQQPVLSVPGFEVPLNLYSDIASRVAVLIAFDQPVNPSTTNISDARLRLEYLDGLGNWRSIDTRVTLEANCTETGSVVRLQPIGLLPPAASFRAVVSAGFQDLVGEAVQQTLETFAVAPTRPVDFSSLTPSDALSDELNESFDFGGDSPESFEDTEALFDTPVGEWGGGQLSAAFSFDGTGGPNGDFDWIVRTGEIFFFDTTNTPINGGPNGVPTTTLNAVNGIVDVRNLIIEAGGEVRVQGPNPMKINATGEVIIRGKLDISGFNAKDVATLNTGNQVEIGGAGTGGGGKGGNANDNITEPSPRGGRGQGPFRQQNLGGEGGEMGFNSTNSKNARRPGGGGGGRFAKDWVGTQSFTSGFGMTAGPGNPGNPASIGALSQRTPAAGGLPGQGPFIDASSENDFFGVRPVVEAGEVTALIRGELPRLWAGYGGGGGGNAGRAYPNPNWNLSADEKGGGGGGGAGALQIKALGRIAFGEEGLIVAVGGRGATGENTNFLDHIGGTGGGGSGGHVVLESATLVDFTDGGASLGIGARDFVLSAGPVLRTGPTGDVDTCCRTHSNGGAGGPGVIQIHVPDAVSPPSTSSATSDILVPTQASVALNPIDQVTSPPAYRMIPTFGARSKVRSKWISIGGADQKPNGTEGLVSFLFGGIDTVDGKILTQGSTVVDLTPLLTDDNLLGSSTAEILADGITLELTGAALDAIASGSTAGISNDVYLRTPALLADCALRMRVVQTPANFQDFTIASATYDEGTATAGDESLRITVTTEGGALDDFNPNNAAGTTGFQLLPRFFRVVTNGLANSLPQTASVFVRFQAARDNGTGSPDELDPLVDWTSNIALFNNEVPGELQFFRFEVEFDLDAQAGGVTEDTEPVKLDFLKIPFVF